MEYQEQYVSYALSNNMSPDEMLAHDKKEYPGAHMMPFMFWIQGCRLCSAFKEMKENS